MSEQLKIAMISFHSCPLGKLGGRDTGGMNVYTRELAQELGRRGHSVDIYTRAHKPEHNQIVHLESNIRLIHLETGGDEEIPNIAFYSYLQRFICEAENFRNSANINYDLIHSHYWLSGLVGKQLQTWWHIPHVITFHTLGATKNCIGIGPDEPELRIESEREIAHSCDRIIAATPREKEEITQHYAALPYSIAIVPCGVNLSLFQPVDREIVRNELGLNHQKVILFVGRIEPLKGLRQLLRALKQITCREAPKLIIVGGDEYSQNEIRSLQKMAEKLHIQNRVYFLGSVIQERLPLFFSAADICVIPSYYESFGMVALESLACGTPVLTTDVGNMRNIIRDYESGYVLPDNSPRHLADKISEFLNREEDQIQHKAARRASVIEYAWSNITDRMLREYYNTIGSYSATANL